MPSIKKKKFSFFDLDPGKKDNNEIPTPPSFLDSPENDTETNKINTETSHNLNTDTETKTDNKINTNNEIGNNGSTKNSTGSSTGIEKDKTRSKVSSGKTSNTNNTDTEIDSIINTENSTSGSTKIDGGKAGDKIADDKPNDNTNNNNKIDTKIKDNTGTGDSTSNSTSVIGSKDEDKESTDDKLNNDTKEDNKIDTKIESKIGMENSTSISSQRTSDFVFTAPTAPVKTQRGYYYLERHIKEIDCVDSWTKKNPQTAVGLDKSDLVNMAWTFFRDHASLQLADGRVVPVSELAKEGWGIKKD